MFKNLSYCRVFWRTGRGCQVSCVCCTAADGKMQLRYVKSLKEKGMMENGKFPKVTAMTW
jgi:hypothetical protein